MSLKSLRTFVAIAETGSFVAAGERLFLTHAAVSMQMKALEGAFGIPLFDRSHRPPQLTEAGKALVPNAVDLIRAYERLPNLLQNPDAEKTQLSLGAIPSSLTGFTPRILNALRRRSPHLHVTLTSQLTEELIQMVEVGSIDAAFVSHIPESPSGLEWRPFFREPLAVLAQVDAPMLPAERLLAELPFIRFRRTLWVGRLIENLLKARRIHVREIMVLDNLEAVVSMVAQGIGVAIAPVQRLEKTTGLTRVVPLPTPTVYRTLGLVFRSARKNDPLIGSIISEVTALAKETGGKS